MILTSERCAEHSFAGQNSQRVHIFLFSSSTMETNKMLQQSLVETTPWKVKRCKSPRQCFLCCSQNNSLFLSMLTAKTFLTLSAVNDIGRSQRKKFLLKTKSCGRQQAYCKGFVLTDSTLLLVLFAMPFGQKLCKYFFFNCFGIKNASFFSNNY